MCNIQVKIEILSHTVIFWVIICMISFNHATHQLRKMWDGPENETHAYTNMEAGLMWEREAAKALEWHGLGTCEFNMT